MVHMAYENDEDYFAALERYWGADELDWDVIPESNAGAGRIGVGGGIWASTHVDRLVDAGFTHVVCAAEELEALSVRLAGGRLTVLPNGTDDDGEPKSPSWFGRIVRFALAALRDPKAKVYFHCAAGVNRGPSAAYVVLRALGHTPADASRLIRDARPKAGILYADSADAALEALGFGGGCAPTSVATPQARLRTVT
jgi:hypothetical protein